MDLIGASGAAIERIAFTAPGYFSTDENEFAWWLADQWSPWQRLISALAFVLTATRSPSSTHAAPRAGFVLVLTGDGKTLLKGGIGMFYDKVPLILPVFENFPDRTVSLLAPGGQALSSTSYEIELQTPCRTLAVPAGISRLSGRSSHSSVSRLGTNNAIPRKTL